MSDETVPLDLDEVEDGRTSSRTRLTGVPGPSPDEVSSYFDDPNFPKLPPGCGNPHPTDEGIFCEKPVPCYAYHLSTSWDPEKGVNAVHWDNDAMPPKREPNPSKAKKIADRVEDNVVAIPVNASLTEALARVQASASPDFLTEAKEVARVVAHFMEEFTSEDILERVQAQTHDNRAMGPVMLWVKGQGLAERTERFSKYRKESNHQQDTAIWRSLVYQAPMAKLAHAEVSNTSPSGAPGSSPGGGTSVTVVP